ATAAGHRGRRLRRRRLRCWRRRHRTGRRRAPRDRAGILAAVVRTGLTAPKLRFELLVAVLELLDRAGELPALRLEAVAPHHQLRVRLRDAVATGAAIGPRAILRRRCALAAAEQVVQEPAAAALALLRRSGAGEQRGSKRGQPDLSKREPGHGRKSEYREPECRKTG